LKLLGKGKEETLARSLASLGRAWAWDMRVNGPAISCFDLAGAWLPFATRYFCMHKENCAGLFWQAIILALMVIALVD
jgi:hypothetical protein